MTQALAAYRLAGDESASTPERDAAILRELPQVYFIASRIAERLPASVAMEDLVHAGVVGLLEAYASFDDTRNAQFRTYARFRVRGAILDSLRTLDWGSRSVRRRAREIAEARTRLEGVMKRRPSNEELAQAMKISLDQLEAALAQIDGLQIVGQHTGTAVEGETIDLIESAVSNDANPFELCFKREQEGQLAAAIATLNEREQLVLSLYYKEELTMREVAKVVGIALSRVSQIHNAALVKLKTAMRPRETAGAPVPLGMLRSAAAAGYETARGEGPL